MTPSASWSPGTSGRECPNVHHLREEKSRRFLGVRDWDRVEAPHTRVIIYARHHAHLRPGLTAPALKFLQLKILPPLYEAREPQTP